MTIRKNESMKRSYFFIALCFCVLLFWDFYNNNQPATDLLNGVANPIKINNVASIEASGKGYTITCDTTKDAYIVLPFSHTTSFWKRIRTDFSRMGGVRSFEIFYKLKGDAGFTGKRKLKRKFVEVNTLYSYDWWIPPGEYEQIRIDFIGFHPKSKVVIEGLKLHDYSFFFYCEAYLYLLAIVILCLFILPGSALYALFAKQTDGAGRCNLLYFYCYSLIFYLALYLVEILAIKLGIPSTIAVTFCFVILTLTLFILLKKQGRFSFFKENIVSEKKVIIFAAFLVVVSCLLVTQLSGTPFELEKVNNDTIDGHTIFSKFDGHDNMFQYVNGKAIADDEPFSKYYGEGLLFYDVQDRGIVAGVIYSVFRTIFTTFSTYIGGSYLTYTLVGICMNVMVIFPLAVLFRRYFTEKFQTIFLIVLCLNTFVLSNFYFTWFKFSGAALFISGLVVLLEKRDRSWSWLVAGMMFGLSSSMHAGNALAIPLVFLWLAYLNIREYGIYSIRSLIFPVVLVAAFTIVNLPWVIVKQVHFPGTSKLLRQHFLAGREGGSLFESAKHFLDSYPLARQIEIRTENLAKSLRLDEFKNCVELFTRGEYRKFVATYNNYQFFLVIFTIVPLFFISFFAAMTNFLMRKIVMVNGALTEQSNSLDREMNILLLLSFTTIISIMLLAFKRMVDVNHELPAGTLLIIHSLLIGWILKSGRAGQLILFVYSVFSAWCIISFSQHYIF